jgi:hypothetical protein
VSLLAAKLAEAQARAITPEPVVVPEGCDSVGSIIFKPLDLRNELPPPEILIDDLLYAEGVHLLSGDPGCGKTTIAMHMAAMAMTEERHVTWLDYESGERQTARRMQSMGIGAALADEFFHYAPFPVKAEDHLDAVAERWPNTAVVLDSFSKALASLGIDENDNSQVTQFTVKVVRACKERGLPVVVIDHITKAGQESLYSRGAGAKLADADVHWRVLKTEEFNRSTSGLITLKQKKDREGFLPFESWWKVGDGDGNLTIDTTTKPASDDAPEDPDGTAPAI